MPDSLEIAVGIVTVISAAISWFKSGAAIDAKKKADTAAQAAQASAALANELRQEANDLLDQANVIRKEANEIAQTALKEAQESNATAKEANEIAHEAQSLLERQANAAESAGEAQQQAAELARFSASARVKLTEISLGRKEGRPEAWVGFENEGPSEARNLKFFVTAGDKRIPASQALIRVFPADRFHNRDSFSFSPVRNKDGSAAEGQVHTIYAEWEDGLGERQQTPPRCICFASHPDDPANNWRTLQVDCREAEQ